MWACSMPSGLTMTQKQATYQQIQRLVKLRHGFLPKTCWTSHVLEMSGVRLRRSWNRRSGARRQVPCPAARRAAIESVLR